MALVSGLPFVETHEANQGGILAWICERNKDRQAALPCIKGVMISDAEIHAVCAKAVQIEPQQEEEFLFALRAACSQYIRERSIFLAYSNPSPHRVRTSETTNRRKRIA